MEYLGDLGRLVGLRTSSSIQSSTAGRYVPSTTVEGRRRVQVVPASPRTWSVGWNGAQGPDTATLSAFTTGAWGPGPWHWVSVLAQRGNLLTPREAGLLDFGSSSALALAGPVLDGDGAWAARSLSVSLGSGWAPVFQGIPVVAGVPVTFSADVLGTSGDAFALSFMDASGTAIRGVYGGEVSGGMSRTSMTEVAPEGAVSVRAGVRPGVTRFARPQVTWTDGPVSYSGGHGCRAAVVDGFSEDLLVANSSGAYSNVSFTVMEVG